MVEEFAHSIAKEMDYAIEASSMERVAAQFLNDPVVYVPKVYREYSSRRMLTIEYVDGIKVSETEKLDQAGLDRPLIAARGADILFKQIFIYGFFHADPHPGNIFVLPENIICLIDLGMTGAVDRSTREIFVSLIESVIQRDEPRTAQVLLKLSHWEEEPDLKQLEKDVADFLGLHFFKPLKEIQLSRLMQHLLELATRNRMRIPPDIFLMLKALSQVECIARQIHPDFDIIQAAVPFIRDVKKARLAPTRLAGDLSRLLEQSYEFLTDFPKDMLEISHALRHKKMSLNLVIKDLEKVLITHDQISNRIAFAIIIAALIIGSAIIVISNMPPMLYGISMIGLIGFLAAGFMGVWLLVAIIKKGRL